MTSASAWYGVCAPAATGLDALPDHSGKPPRWPRDFFAAPPAEIGQVTSADSSVRVGKTPLPAGVRLLLAVGAGALVFGAFYAMAGAQEPDDPMPLYAIGAVLAAVAALLIATLGRPKYTCSYVGAAGSARLTARGGRGGPVKADTLIFADAAELMAGQTRHYTNGIYTGTSYAYTWLDANGRRVLRLKGRHNGNKKPPKQGSPFHYCRATELAWSNHLLERAQQSLNQEGSIPFRVDRSRWVRVGQGFMEFHFGGEPVRVEKSEIAKVTLGSGTFAFQHKDAKWFSKAGKFTFKYGSMANAQLFLLALDKLMGYRWN